MLTSAQYLRGARAGDFMRRGFACRMSAICGAALAVLPLTDGHAAPIRPIDKLESRRRPPAIVTRRVLDQLQRILHLEAYPATGMPPRLPLSDLWFWTSPRGGEIPGLCEADLVTVYFHPAGHGMKGAATQMAASGVSAHTFYHFRMLPDKPQMAGQDWPAVSRADADCAKLDPPQDMGLSAESPESAVEGVWLAQRIARQSELPSLPFKLDCSDYGKGCDASLLHVDPWKVSFVAPCTSEDLDGASAICRDVYFSYAALRLHVIAKLGNDGDETLLRVVPVQTVTVADSRAD